MLQNIHLILDSNYLCHRAKHSTGGLSHENSPTGVMFGFLKSLTVFEEMFAPCQFIFCFDSKHSLRRKLYLAYKAHRSKYTENMSGEEILLTHEFGNQIQKLRLEYLPAIGFKNIFCQRGYESDDIMASLIINRNKCNKHIIITADTDLFQMIRDNVSVYNPQKRKLMTVKSFKQKYGVEPEHYGTIKSIAGCTTDNVKGVQGVGEKTAIKWWLKSAHDWGKPTATEQRINTFVTSKVYATNRKLVCLPFAGVDTFAIRQDKLTKKGWQSVTEQLGMKSLKESMPFRSHDGKRKSKGLFV